MRTSALLLMICISSCTSLKYYMQEGYYEEAFDQSLRKLEKFKKVRYLDIASICLDSLNNQSIQKLQELYKKADESKWGQIFWELVEVDERQDKRQSQTRKGNQISITMMDTRQPKDLARLNAANYHYQ